MQLGQMRRREFVALLGSAVWPLVAYAQRQPVIGFMSARSPQESDHLVEAFRRGLKDEGGYIEGENVGIEFRWAGGDYSRLPALAADLVSRSVTIIAAVGGDGSNQAAKQATATIPIVFATGSDPVGSGLVASLNRPGGNATGVTTSTNLMEPKRLSLLRELAPGVSLVGALVNPKFPAAARQARDLEEAARAIGQHMLIAKASTDDELEDSFAFLVREGIGSLLVARRGDRVSVISCTARVWKWHFSVCAGTLLPNIRWPIG